MQPVIQFKLVYTGTTLSEGNLNWTNSAVSQRMGTFSVNYGKWYFEYKIDGTGVSDEYPMVIFQGASGETSNTLSIGPNQYFDASEPTADWTNHCKPQLNNEIMGVQYDSSNGQVIVRNTGQTWTHTWNGGVTGQYRDGGPNTNVGVGFGINTGVPGVLVNYGQRPFVYDLSSGYKPLQTNNLNEPTVKKGNENFGILTYSASSPTYPITIDGSGGNNGTGELDFGQSPDLVWIKMTNGSENHIVFDTIRGPGNSLRPDENIAQNTTRTNFAFAENGFTFSAAQSEVYQQNDSYVGWCWKAGGAPTARNTAAAGAAQDAGSVKVDGANGSFAQGTIGINSMSVNTTGGFSMVQYTGTGAIGTFPHGLGTTPEWAIFKCLNVGTTDWDCYHVGIGNSRVLKLDQDVVQSAEGVAAYYNRTDPTDTLFTLGMVVKIIHSIGR